MIDVRALRPIVRRPVEIGVTAGKDLVADARVVVSSEQSLFPIDNVFDHQRGPGGSCWIAAHGGEQSLLIVLHAPTRLRSVVVESEQHGGLTQQAIDLAVTADEDQPWAEQGTRSFTFRPYGPSFQTETWPLGNQLVSRLRLRITPDGGNARACLTSVVVHAA